MKFIHHPLACALLLVGKAASQAAPEVVVATRYLEAKGTSHSHLYLYKEEGGLLRQLTRDESGQDRDPIFSPDGETIVFSRDTDKGTEIWSVEPRGGNLHRLPSSPAWYQTAKTAPYFTDQEPDADPKPAKRGDVINAADSTAAQDPRYTAPDHSVELTLHESKTDDDDQIDGPGHGKHYRVKDLKTGKEVELGKLNGFLGLYDLLHINRDGDRNFLIEPPLRVVFFGLHLNSTEGDTSFALDLASTPKRLVRLSPNWAAPIPLPDEPAFLTLTYERYVPIAGSSKTANCSYLERRDASLQKIRYAREGAAVFYGASLYRQGKKPAIITIRKSGE